MTVHPPGRPGARVRVALTALVAAAALLSVLAASSWDAPRDGAAPTSPNGVWARGTADAHSSLPAALVRAAGVGALGSPSPTASPALAAELARVSVGSNPQDAAFDPANGYVYVADSGYGNASGNVTVINGTTDGVVATVPVGVNPDGLAVDASHGRVFVADSGSDNLSVLDAATDAVVATVAVGGMPVGVAFDGQDGDVYVANSASESVSVLDAVTLHIVATIPSPGTPYRVAFDPGNGLVYVSEFDSGNVTVIDGTTPLPTGPVMVGMGPEGLAVNGWNGRVYVADSGDNTLSVLNGSSNTVVDVVAAGGGPSGVAFDNATGSVYVVDTAVNTVTVLNGTDDRVLGGISVGAEPTGDPAYDSANGCVYVADSGADAVSVISPPLSVTVRASPNATDVGSTVTFTVNASGGARPYGGFSWDFGDGTTAQGTALSVSHSFSASGNEIVTASVTDPHGFTATGGTIVPVHDLPAVPAPTASAPSADVGQNVTFSASPRSGTAPYGAYEWSGLPAGCAGTTGPSVTCPASAPGTLTLEVSVTDAVGVSSGPSRPLAFTVNADPTVQLGANRPASDVGSSVVLTATGSLGAPGYRYAWSGLPPGCPGGSARSVTCVPSSVGSPTVLVTLTDSVGVSAVSGPLSLVVNPALSVRGPAVSPSPSTGTPVTFGATVTGGTPPVSLSWNYGDGGTGSGGSALHTYTSAGTFLSTLWVNDSGGGSVVERVNVTVAGPSSTFLGLPATEGYALVGAIVVVAAAAVAFAARRRRGPARVPENGGPATGESDAPPTE